MLPEQYAFSPGNNSGLVAVATGVALPQVHCVVGPVGR